MKTKNIKEIAVAIIIIVISIVGIGKLNETINYQIKVTNINKIISAKHFDEAQENITNSSLKIKDIDMLQEKITKEKEIQNVD